MKTVEKAGEKFIFMGRTLTAKSFYGNSGIEFTTADAARKENPEGTICVINVEHCLNNGGITNIKESFVLSRDEKKKLLEEVKILECLTLKQILKLIWWDCAKKHKMETFYYSLYAGKSAHFAFKDAQQSQ